MNINNFNISDRLKNELSTVIASRKLPHAIIIEKGDIDSRVEFAFYISACFFCESEKTIPCCECRDCIKCFGKYHPDISVFEREKDRKEFSVKIVRDIIKPSVFIKPGEANGRVCIVKDAETMNTSAQNAFLKILEEPPKNVMFILCCDIAGSLLETIRSRATVYSLESSVDENDEEMQKSLVFAEELVNALMLPNEYDFLSKTGVFEKDRVLLTNTLMNMQQIFRNAVLIKNNVSIDCNEVSTKAASFFSMNSLLKLIEKSNELNAYADKNANLNLLLTRFCSCLRQAARG